MIDQALLDKNKCYCYQCLKEDVIEDLSFDPIKNKFIRCNNKNHIRNNITFRYNKNVKKWLTYNGYGKEAISLSESNKKSAEYCRKHGLGINNPEIHQKAIRTQIENGTFNMLNPEFSKKHHEKMIKNKTGIFSDENQKYIRTREAGIKRAKNANTNEKQLKRVQKQLEKGTHITQTRLKRKMIDSLVKNRNFNFDFLCNKTYFEIEKLFTENFQVSVNVLTNKDLKIYKNRCGAIGLTGICKKDGIRYALNAGKSIDLEGEIRKFKRIISMPCIQDVNYDYGRWYHIANDYTDFEISIICVDVTEDEALLQEFLWAKNNNANFKYEIKNGKKEQIPNTHGYWMM